MGIGMLNVGNVREFLLTSTAASEMFWNINSFNPDTGMKTAFKEAFGINDTTATSFVTSYKTMLNAYWKQKSPDVTDIERNILISKIPD